MSLRWWWVRHAPTHATGAIGWTDLAPDLSDRAALARLAAALPAGAAVIASDLARARGTAEALALPGPRLPDEPGLREFHFGRWEGLSFEEIAAREPEAHARFWAEPGPTAAPGGESLDAFAARVAAVTARHNAAPPAADLVAVAHAGTIRAALALALGLPPAATFAFRIGTLSVTRIDWLGPGWAVDRVNALP